MSGKIVCQLAFQGYNFTQYRYEPKQFGISKEDTGVRIFGPGQESALEKFLQVVKPLYVSKKCVNPNYKDTGGRNTVVVYEMDGE